MASIPSPGWCSLGWVVEWRGKSLGNDLFRFDFVGDVALRMLNN